MLFQNILKIRQFSLAYYNNVVARLNGGITIGKNEFPPAVDAANNQVFFQSQLPQGNADAGRILADVEFYRLDLAAAQLVEGFNIVAHRVLLGANVLQNVFGGDAMQANNAL